MVDGFDFLFTEGTFINFNKAYLKDVRSSLQRTQIHMPRHASSARAKY